MVQWLARVGSWLAGGRAGNHGLWLAVGGLQVCSPVGAAGDAVEAAVVLKGGGGFFWSGGEEVLAPSPTPFIPRSRWAELR